jgi:hypothetical protein
MRSELFGKGITHIVKNHFVKNHTADQKITTFLKLPMASKKTVRGLNSMLRGGWLLG